MKVFFRNKKKHQGRPRAFFKHNFFKNKMKRMNFKFLKQTKYNAIKASRDKRNIVKIEKKGEKQKDFFKVVLSKLPVLKDQMDFC